mgnify:CR=1 FL=1
MKKTLKFSALSIFLTLIFLVGCSEKNKTEVKKFTGFFSGNYEDMISDNNVIQNIIAEKIGAECIEIRETDDANAIDKMILSEKYPDFIYGASHTARLIDSGAFIPIDEYWDKYDNIKNYFTPEEWNKIRSDDGHIYYIPSFSKCYMHDTDTIHSDEAFWIQVRVLKWAGYPEINTLDEYFDLIERYLEANPENIGYEILTDGYFYFGFENPPQFLDGYPNDGSCIVDAENLVAIDYNTTPTAEKWFRKLNEEYHKGIIDSDSFVMNKQQYLDKISKGNVLGMTDQFWNFSSAAASLPDECQYIPLGIVIEDGIEEHYHSQVALDVSQGIGISVSCDDVDGALKFINDLLEPEILNLRFWGIEGTDYSKDENGVFYLTDEQRDRLYNDEIQRTEKCRYSYFPFYKGMNQDGINAYSPQYQPAEFYKGLSDIMKECFDAYGVKTFVELLNQAGENPPWYPMWSYTNTFTSDTPYGKAKEDMDNVKHEYLPVVVMSSDFDSAWAEYMEAYKERCDIDAYLDALTEEIRRLGQK